RETALAQIATHPVLEALDHDHQRARSDWDAGGDEQTAGEGEFGYPHDSDTQGDSADDRRELVSRTASVATAIDRQRTADEEYDHGDRRTHEHAGHVDELRVEVVPHKRHRYDEERKDETIDE